MPGMRVDSRPVARRGVASALGAAAVAVLVLGACSAGDDGDVAGAGGDATPTEVGGTAPTATAGGVASGTGPASDATEAPEEAMSIGLVAPSAVDDASFTQSMVDSLERIAAERPLEVEIVADVPESDAALSAAEQLAADGADLVIVHGSQYRSVVDTAAERHPDVSFAWGTAADDVGRPNVFSYEARADEGGYVNGVIAAGLTSSGVIGAVGPIQVGDAGRYLDGFTIGAASIDPALQVSVTYIDSYTDTGLAREAVTVMHEFGADVLTGTSQIVLGPLGFVAENGIPWLATQSPPFELAPTSVAAAQVYRWEVALAEMLDLIDAGTTGGALTPLTLANGGLTIEFNPDFELASEVLANAEAAIAGLTDGTIVTGVT